MQTSATRFGLIRHALTVWNEKKCIQGHQNSPLSTTGRKMAAAWGNELQKFHWNRILASDLGRVQETSELINQRLQLPLHVDHLLREQNWGKWSGLSIPELFSLFKSEIAGQEAAGWEFRPPGGESRMEVLARAQQALRNATAKWPDENILIITHEGIIKSLLYHLLKRSFLPEEPEIIKAYQLHLIQTTTRGQTSLTSLNHLGLNDNDP